MKTVARLPLAVFAVFAAFLVVTLAGCTDGVVGYDDVDGHQARYQQAEHTGKLRHAHLLDRAIKTNDGLGKSTSSEPSIGLIIGVIRGIDKQRVAERYRVAQRYRVANRYRVAERYEYDHVFNGFAWIIEDSLGGDFQELFDTLAADPDIAFFEPDIPTELEPNNVAPEAGGSTQVMPGGVVRIGGSGDEASGVKIFVMDSGVSHSDVNVIESIDFTDSPSGTADIDGHGTHIAGTIAAIDDEDGVVGVAPGAQVHSLKVLPDIDPNPHDGEVDLSTVIAAVEHVTGDKLANPNIPMVVNISLGADVETTAYNALDEAIEASSAAGVIYVVSAGNEGIDAARVTPAHAASAITAGAYDPSTDRFMSFSNYGETVDILAPGEDIVSLSPEGDLVEMAGTSMAAAHVTGAVALFLAENPHASPAQVRDALLMASQDFVTHAPNATTTSSVWIGGMDDMQVPPFLQYAVFANTNLVIDNAIYIGAEGGGPTNANVFAGNNLRVLNDVGRVDGFGYYGNHIRGFYEDTFQPPHNPTRLPSYMKIPPISVPAFDASEFQHLATRTTNGNLRLSGHYDLGTRENPVIWYVSGALRTKGDVSFSGYGVFIVEGNIAFNHDVVADDPGETPLGFYSNGAIRIHTGLTLAGQFFAQGAVVFNSNSTLYGNITAGNSVKFFGNATVYYRPTSPVLTEPFWPMGGDNQRTLKAGRKRRLISRW